MAAIINVDITRKPKDQIVSAVHPRLRVVTRFFGWVSGNHRLWKDSATTLVFARTLVSAAAVLILVRGPDENGD